MDRYVIRKEGLFMAERSAVDGLFLVDKSQKTD